MRTTRRRQSTGTRLAVVALAAPLALVLLGGTASAAAPAEQPQQAAAASVDHKPRQAAPADQTADHGKKPDKAEKATGSPAQPASTAPGQAKRAGGEHAGTSGTSTSPQPLSTADKNGTGANPGDTHAYCSTRDGSPSGNGNGGGEATGKPCAGCVGKADNKNPPGQAPDGTDRNNGYECDGNKGIGRTNPAHTGCRTATVEEPPAQTCATNPALPGCTPAETCATDASLPGCTPADATCATDASLPGCMPGTDV
ncbi:MAG: hypothetical protein ACLGIG_12730, partial [Actinomycetes bacterium]